MQRASNTTGTETCRLEKLKISLENKPCCESTKPDDESKLLETRLHEQTQLIMILKQSAIDTDAKCQKLVEENENLAEVRNREETALEQKSADLARLNEKLKTMKSNCEGLKVFVKEHEEVNEKLMREKEFVSNENDRLLLYAKNEAEEQIQKLTVMHESLKSECAYQERSLSDEKITIELKKNQCRMSIMYDKEAHKTEMKKLMDNLQVKKACLEEMKEFLEKEEENLRAVMPVPESLLKSEARNKSLSKKLGEIERSLLAEQQKNENLQQINNQFAMKVKVLTTKFEQQTADVESREDVKEMQSQVDEAHLHFEQTKEEIAKFKTETQQKLQHERELNQKLRHIH